VARAAGPTVALHPGSGSEHKNWPEASWAGLIHHLCVDTRASLLIVGGEAEGDRLDRLAALPPASRVGLARHLPLVELAARLGECAAFVGHDSGISHLAAAVGLPTIVLWGRTREEIWRPQGENVSVLRDPAGLAGIPIERVRQAVLERLPA